ncbi:MAG: helix-turn-helix transcriptional regulator [Oscillospiraceae bacterium]|nr:helix-turn-helix transcriptional regulator [Oscillospiraceae bacterium]
MNRNFARILTFLRKERGFAQKKVAADLNVSQALLSHYESGRRECGLEFVVNAAGYYDVSCDYLLGCSPDQKGKSITVDDTPSGRERVTGRNMIAALNRTLIVNSVNIIFDLLGKNNEKKLTSEISSFLMLAVYRVFRSLYRVNPDNNKELFSIDDELANAKARAAMCINEAKADAAARLDRLKRRAGNKKIDQTDGQIQSQSESKAITYRSLHDDYPTFASSLLNLINQCEKKIQ